VAVEIIECHLLPRFDVAGAAVLGLYDESHRRRIARTAAAAVASAASLEIQAATTLAAACYVLIGAGVVAYGSAWAAPWLLRLPAAAAVGIIALVGVLPGGWPRTPPTGWLAALALFILNGQGLSGIWHHPRYGHAETVLLPATAWCLAVGVLSQILWDDRPITAPLAHLSWRSGR
jgi:hypothetical protein